MADEKDPKSKSSPWPSARKAEPAEAVEPTPPTDDDEPKRAAWAAPLHRLDRAWTRLDAKLCAFVLVSEIVTLVFWITLKSLAVTGHGGAGQLFRELATALALGYTGHRLTKGRRGHQIMTLQATLAGFVIGRYWGEWGTEYCSNVLAWIQNASILVFFGGVAEIAKRLTLWLALLGASVATGQGKHINVDVVMRFLSPRARVPVAILGWVTAAVVSGSAAWGFFDNLAIEDFHAPTSTVCPGETTKKCPAPPGVKIDHVLADTGRNLFLARRQLALDLRSLPKVLSGTPYAKWLTATEWNEWVREGGWESRFSAEDVKQLELPPDYKEFRQPAVTSIPGASGERIHMILVPLLNMVFPFGLVVIAIRFLIRSILALTGWVKVDPDAAHSDEDLVHAHEQSVKS
jgi:TRAP-type C4-dicarboxylate transport system permease small subunit